MPPQDRAAARARGQAGVSRFARPVAGRRRSCPARSRLSPAESQRIREHDPRSVPGAGRSRRDAARRRQGPRLRQHRRGAGGVHGTGRSLSPRGRRRDRHGARARTAAAAAQQRIRRSPTASRPARNAKLVFRFLDEGVVHYLSDLKSTHVRNFAAPGGGDVSHSLPGPGLSQHAADQSRSRRRRRSQGQPRTAHRRLFRRAAGTDRDRLRGLVPRGGRVFGAAVRHRQRADRAEPQLRRARACCSPITTWKARSTTICWPAGASFWAASICRTGNGRRCARHHRPLSAARLSPAGDGRGDRSLRRPHGAAARRGRDASKRRCGPACGPCCVRRISCS